VFCIIPQSDATVTTGVVGLGLPVSAVLVALANQCPIFHSEADFQHAIAWEIHKHLPRASVRLERPVEVSHVNKRLHVDIWIVQDDHVLAIELKYKTRALQVLIGNEQYALRSQTAQDLGRYDFTKDIGRVENIVTNRAPRASGYAILLTNDPSSWTHPRSDSTADARFRLHEGNTLRGDLGWGPGASEGTKRGREDLLQLRRSYPLRWVDYSRPAEGSYGRFRYLVVEVENGASAPAADPSVAGTHWYAMMKKLSS
jgi:hypothetical protein